MLGTNFLAKVIDCLIHILKPCQVNLFTRTGEGNRTTNVDFVVSKTFSLIVWVKNATQLASFQAFQNSLMCIKYQKLHFAFYFMSATPVEVACRCKFSKILRYPYCPPTPLISEFFYETSQTIPADIHELKSQKHTSPIG
jgi:hypothetical protein